MNSIELSRRCKSILTGWIVGKTRLFAFAFLAAGLACLLGASSLLWGSRS
jgi:hypothetical protein